MAGKPRLLAFAAFSAGVFADADCLWQPMVPLALPENARPGAVLLEPCKIGEREADCGRLIALENPDKADSG
jgi:hypothetical protein